jgi:hypothetical protein
MSFGNESLKKQGNVANCSQRMQILEGNCVGTFVEDNGVAVVDKERIGHHKIARLDICKKVIAYKNSSRSGPPWRGGTWRMRGIPGGRDRRSRGTLAATTSSSGASGIIDRVVSKVLGKGLSRL